MATSLIPRIVSLVAVAALAVGTGAPPALASTLATGERAPASALEPAARADARAALAEARALS
ncbi:MAG: hypothetical protein WBP61_16090, partial [Nocardioides sp.]